MGTSVDVDTDINVVHGGSALISGDALDSGVSKHSTMVGSNKESRSNKVDHLEGRNGGCDKTENERSDNNEKKHKSHIDALRKLKSNPEINLKRGNEINKNACLFISEDLPVERKCDVLNGLIEKLSMHTFNLYFPRCASTYNNIPVIFPLLNGGVEEILIGLKYLIDNVDQMNFLIVSFVSKLKKREFIKRNKVIMHLIDFLLNKLFENNVNYRYKRTHMLDFYDNLMWSKTTFFESGVTNDAIDIRDLRLIYFYKHDIKMKDEKSFIKERDLNCDNQAGKEKFCDNMDITKRKIQRNFVLNDSLHKLSHNSVKRKKRSLSGEIPIPNVYLGLYGCFDCGYDGDIRHSCNNQAVGKKRWLRSMDKCVKKCLTDKKKCSKIESNICNCISSVIVNVNNDARLREKVNIAKKEVKNVKNVLIKIKKMENLVDKLIMHDPEAVIFQEGGEEVIDGEEETDVRSSSDEEDTASVGSFTREGYMTGMGSFKHKVDTKEIEGKEMHQHYNRCIPQRTATVGCEIGAVCDSWREESRREPMKRSFSEMVKYCGKDEDDEVILHTSNYPNFGKFREKTFSEMFSSEKRKRKRKKKKEKNENSRKEGDEVASMDKNDKGHGSEGSSEGDESDESIKTFYLEHLDFNFVFLGSVKKGSDRHKSLLFKVLCDAVDIPCRFVRHVEKKKVIFYNLVLIPSIPEKNVPESIIPIFWEEKTKTKGNACGGVGVNAQSKITISTFLNSIRMKFDYIDSFFLKVWERSNEFVNIDEYFTFGQKLGIGGFGEVWRVSLKGEKVQHDSIFFFSIKDTSNFALKIMEMNEFNLNESVIMREKAHTGVVQFYCVFKGYQMLLNRQHEEERKESLCFLLELADTSLEKVFCDKKVAYNLSFVRLTLLEIANVMAYIHKPNARREFYIYRDLKPDNILIKGNKILMTDFNLSRKVNQDFEYLMSQCCGTKGHLAPEQKSVAYDQTVDVWAFAIIISKFLKHKNFHYFSHDGYKVDLKHFEVQNQFLLNLLLACIDESPFMRPTFEDIVKLLIGEVIRNELERCSLDKIAKTT
ncbi:protein kinase, putative [Plasmodium ovale]|uniref:Protein kinase, putative n=1 Tax=Plasmodium ovale TaxID=36330 RepID=A0A1D3U7Z2_PLAOA|nr:protein kinase, putative [Plasmodium ovale]